ncbi:MAG: dTDP-4-dehydrorhamnose 3,5-epimerase [Candidatus Fischerbacteria bacterium RBG_13_37_8]|uniref:dTDP-4-dehydrorhamnose 3,5-epimerase n=1 Tax=Candidatus Fischerbacteria bacterium RBG_13_37_8 TaxID=1817863 RepID=A0A1F5VNR2_9BACT|nr:MAG: dTDP-4-dehydrorhamnose 3,5-epimerase [Candidatus Fischerbacteria bacterium RBG_13_37_8]
MLIKERKLRGVYEIELMPYKDSRGYFMRTYSEEIFSNFGMHKKWIQENHSVSLKRGTIRGLHFQFPPYTETKLIRVVKGKIYDVFVDLRKDSPTFAQWDSIILSAANKKMIFIPRGFSHGFCTLTNNCEVIYKVDNSYYPEKEGSILWNDPDLGITWPTQNPIISEKDMRAKPLKEFIALFNGLET